MAADDHSTARRVLFITMETQHPAVLRMVGRKNQQN